MNSLNSTCTVSPQIRQKDCFYSSLRERCISFYPSFPAWLAESCSNGRFLAYSTVLAVGFHPGMQAYSSYESNSNALWTRFHLNLISYLECQEPFFISSGNGSHTPVLKADKLFANFLHKTPEIPLR